MQTLKKNNSKLKLVIGEDIEENNGHRLLTKKGYEKIINNFPKEMEYHVLLYGMVDIVADKNVFNEALQRIDFYYNGSVIGYMDTRDAF